MLAARRAARAAGAGEPAHHRLAGQAHRPGRLVRRHRRGLRGRQASSPPPRRPVPGRSPPRRPASSRLPSPSPRRQPVPAFATSWPDSAGFIAIFRPLSAHSTGPCWSKTRPSPSTTCPPAASGSAGPAPATSSCPPGPHRRPSPRPASTGDGNAATFARYIAQGYFSLVALNFADTAALDHAIRADLTAAHYHIIAGRPLRHPRHLHRLAPTSSGETRTRSSDHHAATAPPQAAYPLSDRAGRSRLVLPPPPDDDEKYSYVQRNLPYLTTILISAACLIISQVRFETQDLALWPFMLFTATYVALPGDQPAGEFRGPRVRPRRPPGAHPGLAPARVSRRGHLPAHLRRADRAAAQHLDRRLGTASRTTRARRGPTSSTTGPPTRPARLAEAFGFALHPPARLARAQEERQPAVRLRPDQRRVPGHPGRGLRAAPRLPRRDAALHGRSRDRDRPDPAVLPGAARRRPGSRAPRGRSRRCSTGRSRWPATGSARPSACGTSAVYRRAALEPQGGPTLIPYAEDVHTGLDVRRAGWSMVYLPILLSTGICPDNLDAFVRQQYRWCSGNVGIVFSRRLWSVRDDASRPG